MISELKITPTQTHGGVVVLAVDGELGVHTSDTLRGSVIAVAEQGHRHVVLDLAQVPFCDSSGLNALIVIYRHVNAAGGSLTVAAAPPRLMRLLQLTGIHRMIPTHPTVEHAVRSRRQHRAGPGQAPPASV